MLNNRLVPEDTNVSFLLCPYTRRVVYCKKTNREVSTEWLKEKTNSLVRKNTARLNLRNVTATAVTLRKRKGADSPLSNQ